MQKQKMNMPTTDKHTYILLSGIKTPQKLKLSEHVELYPADTSHLDLDTALSACCGSNDISVVTGFIPLITAQLKISANTSKELATISWNTMWDVILLSAFIRKDIGFNLESDVPAELISRESNLRATNHHMHGLVNSDSHSLTIDEIEWLGLHFGNARKLLDNEQYNTAVHCLASYRWHTMPRIQMAVLWAGIEGIFGASSEIRFRISLYIARFLHLDESDQRNKTFESIKSLYNTRSAAVHGSKIKGDVQKAVEESAEILCKILKKCTTNNALPNETDLVP